MTIQGLIFDLDGVIADTHEFHYRSWKRLAEEEGLTFTPDDNEAVRGLTREASLRHVLGRREVSAIEAVDMMERKNRYFQETMRDIQPMPGVLAMLDEAHAAGLRIGVGSASQNARRVLEYLKLTGKFDVIGDGHTVVNHKPAPDIFVWVAGALRLPPRQVMVLEDLEAGINAALQGGFYVTGIGSSAIHKAHVVVASLADVTLADLLAKFQPMMAAPQK